MQIEDVFGEDRHVGQLADGDGALDILFEVGVGRVVGVGPEGVVQADPLLGVPAGLGEAPDGVDSATDLASETLAAGAELELPPFDIRILRLPSQISSSVMLLSSTRRIKSSISSLRIR